MFLFIKFPICTVYVYEEWDLEMKWWAWRGRCTARHSAPLALTSSRIPIRSRYRCVWGCARASPGRRRLLWRSFRALGSLWAGAERGEKDFDSGGQTRTRGRRAGVLRSSVFRRTCSSNMDTPQLEVFSSYSDTVALYCIVYVPQRAAMAAS